MQARAVSASSTVPAPRTTSEPKRRATCSITPSAPGTVMVISSTGTPPSRTASTTFIAWSADCARTTGTSPTSAIFRRTSCLVITGLPLARNESALAPQAGGTLRSPQNPPASAGHPRGPALHDPLDLGQRRHRRVARGRHRERSVRGPALHRPLRSLAHQEAVDEPRGERVAAAHPVEDLQALAGRRLVELAALVAHGAPVVDGGALDAAQRGRHHPEVRELLHCALDHA